MAEIKHIRNAKRVHGTSATGFYRFNIGAGEEDLFTVKEGAPIDVAFRHLGALLDVCANLSSLNIETHNSHATAAADYLLDMACALHSSLELSITSQGVRQRADD